MSQFDFVQGFGFLHYLVTPCGFCIYLLEYEDVEKGFGETTPDLIGQNVSRLAGFHFGFSLVGLVLYILWVDGFI